MAQGRSAREQIGVDLPDPPDAPQAVQQPEPTAPEPDRPAWLPDNFDNPEAFAASYKTLQEELRQRGENQKRMEAQLNQLSETIENFTAAPPATGPTVNDDAIRARLQESLDTDPVGTIAYLAQQYATAAIDERMQAYNNQANPAIAAQQERDNQLLAMMVDQRLGERISDWDEYRDKVGEAIVRDQSLIPEGVLMNPEATVNAIERVYQMEKAKDIIAEFQNGGGVPAGGAGGSGGGPFVTSQMKRSAQTMTGSGVRNPVEPTPTDEKMEALQAAVKGMSYGAWRG